MPSWVIIGAARGIGFGFVKELSASSSNTVVALIRSQSTAGELNQLAAERSNIHVIEADIYKPESLNAAVSHTAKAVDGKVDVLIHNAYTAGTAGMLSPTAFAGKESEAESEMWDGMKGNVLGPLYTINAFLPLIRKGEAKKIVYISSGNADVDAINTAGLPQLIGYSASKAAGNILIAKFAAELAGDNIKTLSISPGWVNTDAVAGQTQDPAMLKMFIDKFQKLNPEVKGPISVEESVGLQLKVIAGLDASTSGAFLSHFGNKQWV